MPPPSFVKKRLKNLMVTKHSNPLVLTSTVADGSMLNRHNPSDMTVIKNRTVFLEKHGIKLAQTTRVKTIYTGNNYCRYSEVGVADMGNGMTDDDVITSDGLVTRLPGHALLLPVADCIGATFFDPQENVLMVSHLGRHSLEQQGAVRSVKFLVQRYNCIPSRLRVWLTPAPSKAAYPIWALNNKGMKEVCFEQLRLAGILDKNIIDNPADSATDHNYYSYSEFLKGNRTKDGDYVMVAMMT